MTITIEGNRHSFQLSQQIENIGIELDIILPEGAQAPNYQIRSEQFQVQLDADRFNELSESIKGKSPLDVSLSLQRVLPNQPLFSGSFLRRSQTETSLFQTLFLIYNWVDIEAKYSQMQSINSKVYDDFIMDYASRVGSVPDIYFLKVQRISTDNMNYIQRLVQINLLAKATFTAQAFGHTITTYFIPLLKPGVSKEYFSSANDKTGDKTYKFWKQILADRDARLNYWSINRF
ncbi:MAG: hypothetical protein V4450_17475 [Bacteroidota bacterium]